MRNDNVDTELEGVGWGLSLQIERGTSQHLRKMIQWVRHVPYKPDDLSLISGARVKVKGTLRAEIPNAGWIQPAAPCPGERAACSTVSQGNVQAIQPESLGQYHQAQAGSSNKRVGVRTMEAGRGRDTCEGRLPAGTGGD